MSQMNTTGLHYICLLFIYLASLFQNKPSDRRFIMLLFFLFIYIKHLKHSCFRTKLLLLILRMNLAFYLIYGFQQKNQANIMVGTITFLLSTFTAYVQYAWEALNKSLFFIIGGLLLFGISFILERLRRKREQGES